MVRELDLKDGDGNTAIDTQFQTFKKRPYNTDPQHL